MGTNLRFSAKLVRRWLRRLRQSARYGHLSLQDAPVLFANSFPKSGTHLLTQVLQGFPRFSPTVDSGLPAIVTFQGDTGRPRSSGEIIHDLQRLLPGDIAYGHLHALPEVADFLSQAGMAAYFILRDPRDVVISHVHYVTEMEPGHIHHRYYTQALHSFNERLRTSILGIPDPAIPFPDICQRFLPYLGWIDCTLVLTLRYEDFLENRSEALGRVYDQAVQRGLPALTSREEATRLLESSIDPKRSPTFRSGKAGGWRTQFSPENKQLFKDIAGDLLVQLGYERNHEW
jgi:hypothetical protein